MNQKRVGLHRLRGFMQMRRHKNEHKREYQATTEGQPPTPANEGNSMANMRVVDEGEPHLREATDMLSGRAPALRPRRQSAGKVGKRSA